MLPLLVRPEVVFVCRCRYARVALEGTQLYSHALVAAYTPTTAEAKNK